MIGRLNYLGTVQSKLPARNVWGNAAIPRLSGGCHQAYQVLHVYLLILLAQDHARSSIRLFKPYITV